MKPKTPDYEEFYLDEDNTMYIRLFDKERETTWGWWKWYDKKFRMCIKDPREIRRLKLVSKEEFDKIYFSEKL